MLEPETMAKLIPVYDKVTLIVVVLVLGLAFNFYALPPGKRNVVQWVALFLLLATTVYSWGVLWLF